MATRNFSPQSRFFRGIFWGLFPARWNKAAKSVPIHQSKNPRISYVSEKSYLSDFCSFTFSWLNHVKPFHVIWRSFLLVKSPRHLIKFPWWYPLGTTDNWESLALQDKAAPNAPWVPIQRQNRCAFCGCCNLKTCSYGSTNSYNWANDI